MTNRSIPGTHSRGPISLPLSSSVLSVSSAVSFLSATFSSSPLACPPTLQRRRATNSNPSHSIGNCCPTSRTRSHIYHYIKYPCRRADNFRATPQYTVSTSVSQSRLSLGESTFFSNPLLHAPSPVDVHSGCWRERTLESLHTQITANAAGAPAAVGFVVFPRRHDLE
jgi:hypothetical protein